MTERFTLDEAMEHVHLSRIVVNGLLNSPAYMSERFTGYLLGLDEQIGCQIIAQTLKNRLVKTIQKGTNIREACELYELYENFNQRARGLVQ